MTKCIFRSGFVWKIVENKWPHFEAAFHGFDVTRCAMLSDEELEAPPPAEPVLQSSDFRSVSGSARACGSSSRPINRRQIMNSLGLFTASTAASAPSLR